MKLRMLFALGAILLGSSALEGSPVLVTTPTTGSVAGTPGSIVGWGFSLTPDANYSLSAISSFLEDETNPALGTWNDVISYQGGPDAGVLLPDSAVWTENFSYASNADNQTGLGWFQIAPNAAPGQSDAGLIHIDFELDSVSPGCSGCYVATESIELPFTVTVPGAVAPEPRMLPMMLLALGAACWRKVRKT
jgi:hypothetical protein